MIDNITFGELQALSILYGVYSNKSAHEAANEIIQLAERIKAERAVIAMEVKCSTYSTAKRSSYNARLKSRD